MVNDTIVGDDGCDYKQWWLQVMVLMGDGEVAW
jgi:hypothetical protein